MKDAGVDEGGDAAVDHRGTAEADLAVVNHGRYAGAVEALHRVGAGEGGVVVRAERGRSDGDRAMLPMHEVAADRMPPGGVAGGRAHAGVELVEDVVLTVVMDGPVGTAAPPPEGRGEVVERAMRVDRLVEVHFPEIYGFRGCERPGLTRPARRDTVAAMNNRAFPVLQFLPASGSSPGGVPSAAERSEIPAGEGPGGDRGATLAGPGRSTNPVPESWGKPAGRRPGRRGEWAA